MWRRATGVRWVLYGERLRYYVQLKLLRPLEFRGAATRYPRRELLRLLGILRMRSETRASLAEIKQKLDTLTDPELEGWLLAGPLPAAAAAALGVPAADSPRFVASPAAGNSEPCAFDGGTSAPVARRERAAVETWQRVCLLPARKRLAPRAPRRRGYQRARGERARRLYGEGTLA
jgi:DNA-binding transcriptional MerR regulator